ncbi:MAG TPA: dihydrodipicolinate synthase family protein [Clostridiales bacterium UBA8960]|jgi:4-hydroxy-tetrahydrodipicolinate synthase|nr:dihydrodipicolinate synthase family protein [Clostridiales bacterium UBA8960]
MKIEYKGVWPTMIAAFDEAGNLDMEANRNITDYLIDKGSDGLFAVCQSSEMFMLSTEEKVALAKCVVEHAKGRVPVITSGHTSDAIEDQIEELKAMATSGADAIVLVSNRLAKEDESSEVLIGNITKIMNAVPDIKFGIYECPYPYRRLLTDEELRWCAESGRIIFLKDVSCDIDILRRRVDVVKGTELKLFNANTETLLDSLIAGYHGYNGVMGNFHIDLYKWLFDHYTTMPEVARDLQNNLTEQALIENYAYPVNAKYHMQKSGVKMGLFSRRLDASSFTETVKGKVESLIIWEDATKKKLNL